MSLHHVWGYACLSDDTEILTEEGWVRYDSPNVGQLAAAFDPDSGELRWQRIEAVHRYEHEGDMVEVGPSLVTDNHRVVIDEATAGVPCLPDLWDDLHATVGVGQEGDRVVLLSEVQRRRQTAGPAVPERDASGLDGGLPPILFDEDVRTWQSGLEGRRYRVQEARELLGRALRASAGVGISDGEARWLRDGAPAGDGGADGFPVDADGVREPRGPRSDEQRSVEPDALAGQSDAQAVRAREVPGGDGEPDSLRDYWRLSNDEHRRGLNVEDARLVEGYRGVVWCITVPTGAFLARRNGVVFATGNSGFPKSKASLKPAWEPIVMARKPGPLRDLAIDACRIPTTQAERDWIDKTARPNTRGERHEGTVMNRPPAPTVDVNPAGRWPANIVLSSPIFDGGWEGVVGGGVTVDGGGLERATSEHGYDGGWTKRDGLRIGKGDSGTYSRFFILPKADREDREPILDEYAYRLHRERGECGKLALWAGADLSRSDQTDSTSRGRAISAARSPATPTDSNSDTSSPGKPPTDPSPTAIRSTTSTATSKTTGSTTSSSSILSPTSGSTLGASSETASGGSPAPFAESSSGLGLTTGTSPERAGRSTDDAGPVTSGSSSSRNVCGRCGKPLPRVGSHPTVKPTDLMRHLVRLVTPPGGTVLDPFLGSGTTALAAEMEGFAWIGIEREAEYVAIAEARLNGTQRGLGLESA